MNLNRTMITIVPIVLALGFYNNLAHFNAIAGALACCPLAFTLPALFHLRLKLEKSNCQKIINIGMIVISIFFMIFTAEEGIRTWD